MIPDKLFINLKILSKIQKNGRISRSSDGIIALENENFYQSVKRFMTSDSRRQSVFEINSIINETIECMNNIVNSKFMNKMYSNTDEYYKNCENLALLLREITAAKVGIENLKFTYSADANINSQLDILIIKINSSIKDLNYKLSYFQSLLPDAYKAELEAQKNIPPSYYLNENKNIQQLSTSPAPTSYSDFAAQESSSVVQDQQNFMQEQNFMQDASLMPDELNSTIIDMNNMDSVI